MERKKTARLLGQFELRLALFGLGCALWAAALGARLLHLQLFRGEFLRERAEAQQQDVLVLDPMRGTIFDRHGRELAVSVEVESVYATPKTLRQPEAASGSLARCLKLDPDELLPRLQSGRRFVWLRRKADPAAADCVRGLDLEGVDLVPEKRRFYPKRSTAAHVLGYVGMDNRGMSGVEYSLDSEIHGRAGQQIILTDARRRRASSRVERRPEPGRSVHLTLDETLQHVAQSELERAVAESRARSGVAIVMRSATGEILAMAVAPAFNPNTYVDFPAESWRNRAVTDPYEPGSTFKLITAAAALEEGVVSEEERIDCGRGGIEIDGQLILDNRTFDVLPFREVVEQSSNVGMIRVAQRLGRERLGRYLGRFGFGEPTGVGLPGESRGIVRDWARWGGVSLAAISFGQEIAVTPLQLVAAVNAIANSGYLMKPRLIEDVRSPEGRLLRSFPPEPAVRVIGAETARRLAELMVGVVERGTGKRAAIPGYRVAGKTGTAEKADPGGGYSRTDFVASFVGFVPAESPELTALVVLDSPEGAHSGGLEAAPVFQRIAERSLRYLGVAPAGAEGALKVASRWPEPPVPAPEPLPVDRAPLAAPVARIAFAPGAAFPTGAPPMPALVDLPARDAVFRAVAAGLAPETSGAGRVVEQFPLPGEPVERGARCLLVLSEARRR